METDQELKEAAKFLRYWALRIATKANSGHPTSGLSAADLMAALFATSYHYDFQNPNNPNNDRLIFSKGHASPLYYPLFALAGAMKTSELDGYRTFKSNLEGHPTPRFPFTEASTGSLGQGLSIGVGMALALRSRISNFKFQISNFPKVYVLLGDGEMAEGSVWEALEVASKYKLDNLIGILDVNRLGQSEETMLGHHVEIYQKRISAFGWGTKVIDGHDFKEIVHAYRQINTSEDCPQMIIAKTVKGKGVSFLEDKNGWHGKALAMEEFERAVKELGKVDKEMKITVQKPPLYSSSKPAALARREVLDSSVSRRTRSNNKMVYKIGDQIATRKAYGEALTRIGGSYANVIALDAEVKNSTFSELFKAAYPDRFFEMYIAEQNMVGAAVGFAKRGKIPFVSTFAAFFTRAFDQIRMAAISQANIKFCGSHAGVSIGEDGPSQMGLEDLAMFRAVHGCSVLYPSDAISTDKLVEEMAKTPGMSYIRTTRPATPVIYKNNEAFPIGGCKIHYDNIYYHSKNNEKKSSRGEEVKKIKAVIVAAGITLHEALKAQAALAKEGIEVIVVDCYSIKPIDKKTIRKLGEETGVVITVEDHWFDGGLGDAVLNVFTDNSNVKVHKLAVTKMPRSGKPDELLMFEKIDTKAIMTGVKQFAS